MRFGLVIALGFVFAAGLGVAAHLIARDTVALPVESIEAGEGLAPVETQAATTTRARRNGTTGTTTAQTTTRATRTGTTATETDEDRGRGRGRGRGRSGSDSGSSGSGSSGSGGSDSSGSGGGDD
jgi:hypothetical protein